MKCALFNAYIHITDRWMEVPAGFCKYATCVDIVILLCLYIVRILFMMEG